MIFSREHICIAALYLAAVAAPAQGLDCSPPAGSELVLRSGVVLLLGEVHGTREAPASIEALACEALRRGLTVTVALELPVDETTAIHAYLRRSGLPSDRARLLDGAFWRRNDGRSSLAMLRLLDSLRQHVAAGRGVQVILIEDPSSSEQREQGMAAQVKAALLQRPNDVHLVLTGNLHSRVSKGVPWDEAFEPMGYLLKRDLPSADIVALELVYTGGSAWNCTGPLPGDCGAHPVRGPKNQQAGITLFAAEGGAFSGRCSVGEASPSEPARARGAV